METINNVVEEKKEKRIEFPAYCRYLCGKCSRCKIFKQYASQGWAVLEERCPDENYLFLNSEEAR